METTNKFMLNKFMFKCENHIEFHSFIKILTDFAQIKRAKYSPEAKEGTVWTTATYPLMLVIANSFCISSLIADTINYKKDFTGGRICKGRFNNTKMIID